MGRGWKQSNKSTMADILLVLLICIILAFLLRLAFKKGSMKHPPGPLALPIIGHLHHFRSGLPHQDLASLSKRYGALMYIQIGFIPCVIVTSAELAKEFLKTKDITFANRPTSMAIEYLSYGGKDFLFAPYGPYWRFMKKVCMSDLLGGKALDLLLPVRRDELRRFLEEIHRKATGGEAVDMEFEVGRLSNNIISRMVMSRRCSGDANDAEDVQNVVGKIAQLLAMVNLSDYIWFLKNIDLQGHKKMSRDVFASFDAMTEKIIVEHEEARLLNKGSQAKDMLDLLLDISLDQTSEIKLTRDGIKAFILDVFSAGTDTSASAIVWGLSELVNHPEIMEKATREIESVVGNDRLVQESDIPNLPYLQSIVKETLRLHPSAPVIPRESSEDCEVGGYNVPAKTRLLINIWAIGRDPKYWENPLEFCPERFMDSGKNLDVRGQHFQLLVFGTGRRTCPGMSLGLLVTQITLACMIQCFQWKGTKGGDQLDMKEGPGITLARATPLVCFPVPKHNSLPIQMP